MSFTSWLLSSGEKTLIRIFSKVFFPPCSAATVVLNDEDEILVVEKGDYLMLPGGFLQREETFEECAVREAREETGMDIEIREKVEEDERGFAGVEVVFHGKISGGELSGSWEGEPRFLPREEVSGANWRWNRDVERLLRKAGENE
jgi:ADP-ribose pyrophosphatase YjhB (NUDIX family)